MSLKRLLNKTSNALNQNSPAILIGFGVIGVAGTAILAVKATPKAIRIVEDEFDKRVTLASGPEFTQSEKFKHFKKSEIIKLTWKGYLPAFLMGATTVACIVGSGRIMNRRNAAIYYLYTMSEGTLKEYQKEVIKLIGEKKEKQVRDDTMQTIVSKNPPKNNVIVTGNGDVLMLDLLSGRYFESNVERVRRAINDFNHDLISDMVLTVNDWNDKLELPHTAIGDDMGWSVDKMLDIEFSTTLTDENQPCIVLDYFVLPDAQFRQG